MTSQSRTSGFIVVHTMIVALYVSVINAGCGKVEPASVDAGNSQLIDASILDAVTSDATVVDGALDSGVAPYDVVYGINWRIVEGDITASGQGIFEGWLVLVNTSEIGIPMSSLRVISVEDNHPTAAVSLIAHPRSEELPSGKAAGFLIKVSQALVTKELLPEPIEDFGGAANLMTLTVSAPAGVYSFTATAVIEFGGVEKTLDFNIERSPLPVTWYQPVLFERR